jgi:hypothetical protein
LVKSTSVKHIDKESYKNEFFSTPRIDLEPSDNCLSSTITAPTFRHQHSHFSSFLLSSMLFFRARARVCLGVFVTTALLHNPLAYNFILQTRNT